MDKIILDRDKKVFFIQVPRTGSTSIFDAYKIYHSNLLVDMNVSRHAEASEFKHLLKDFEDYQGYAVVRNPFTQIISLYSFFIATTTFIKPNDRLKYVYDPDLIKQFIDKYVQKKHPFHTSTRQSNFVTIDEKIPDNIHIFKYEDGMSRIIKHMNDKYNYRLTYAYENRGFNFDRKELLANDYFRENIVEYLKLEFELFGYSKNIKDIK